MTITPTLFVYVVAILVSIVVIVHLFISARDRRKLQERNLIEISKRLIRKYNVSLDEDHCADCEDVCVLYRAYLEMKEEDE